MISEFYRKFKVRDYIENETLKGQSYDHMIDCSLGTNPFIDDSFIKRCILQGNCEINKYVTSSYENLREELIKYWGNYLYLGVDRKNISFGSGTMGIIRNICQFLINEGQFVLGYSPQFPRFASEVELKKGIYEYYKLKEENNFKFIVDDFIKMINKKYSMIYIDNPNNPTGQIIKIGDIEKIAIKAKKYEITVIIDECYGDYMPLENSAIKLVKKYDNVVVLRSASKFFGLPNHRVGYLFASEDFINIYNEISIPFPFSDLSANIFVNVLRNYNNLLNSKLEIIKANQIIYKNLKEANILYTNIETPIFTIKTNKYDNLTEILLKNGIISEDCSNFINLDSKFARIRVPKNYKKLIKILCSIL